MIDLLPATSFGAARYARCRRHRGPLPKISSRGVVASLPRRRIVDTHRRDALRRLATDDDDDQNDAMVGGGGGGGGGFPFDHHRDRRRRRRRSRWSSVVLPQKVGVVCHSKTKVFLLQRFSSFFYDFRVLFFLLNSSSSFRFFESLNF